MVVALGQVVAAVVMAMVGHCHVVFGAFEGGEGVELVM